MKRYELMVISEMINIGTTITKMYNDDVKKISLFKFVCITSTVYDLIVTKKISPKKTENSKLFLSLFLDNIKTRPNSLYYSFASLDVMLRSRIVKIENDEITLLESNDDKFKISDYKFIVNVITELKNYSDEFLVKETI